MSRASYVRLTPRRHPVITFPALGIEAGDGRLYAGFWEAQNDTPKRRVWFLVIGGIGTVKTPLNRQYMGVSKNRGGPQNGWFLVENPIM